MRTLVHLKLFILIFNVTVQSVMPSSASERIQPSSPTGQDVKVYRPPILQVELSGAFEIGVQRQGGLERTFEKSTSEPTSAELRVATGSKQGMSQSSAQTFN